MAAAADNQTMTLHFPEWVPEAARNYLVHTETGVSIRALARANDCHASTILRQVRRFENRRDDPLVDDALRQLSRHVPPRLNDLERDTTMMHVELRNKPDQTDEPDDARIEQEGLRILRRLSETGAVLAVARDMEMAVVVRDDPVTGASTRTAVTERMIAQAMALRDWISCTDPDARIARYRITNTGRTELRRLIAASENRAQGFADAAADFDIGDTEANRSRSFRAQIAESPLTLLARRRDKDGKPFLTRDLVSTAERLREDFELACLAPDAPRNWDSFVVAGDKPALTGANGGSGAARDRVASALADLGPGLGDVVLRCCCQLEGLETAEKNMGWAARSGKIVLRIALQRLKRHYDGQGRFAPKIG